MSSVVVTVDRLVVTIRKYGEMALGLMGSELGLGAAKLRHSIVASFWAFFSLSCTCALPTVGTAAVVVVLGGLFCQGE